MLGRAPWLAIDWRQLARTLVAELALLAISTVGVLALEQWAGLTDASALYLLAVAIVAVGFGSWAAVGTAIGAFLAYNYLFVPPLHTFVVADPQGLLTLLVLLALGIGIGRLTGSQRDRARESDRREREARSLFAISRAIATARRTPEALPAILERLAADARMERVWIGLGSTIAQEAVVADTQPQADAPTIGSHVVLRRTADETNSSWVRLSPPLPRSAARSSGVAYYRVEIAGGSDPIGSLWAARPPALGLPTTEESRLLAAAADQVGQGLLRDRLTEQATELEVTRRSDELKAALLDSVSHDLRTPLASIRATAGTLSDRSVALGDDERAAMAAEIDQEAERLSSLVGGLLDMSRIEGGALQPRREAIPVSEVVLPALERARPLLGQRRVELRVADDLPPLSVDPLLADRVVANLLENSARHTPDSARIVISARAGVDTIHLRVEDDGPGVPPEAIPHLFTKFYRAGSASVRPRGGTGLGLAVVKGMAEAMGGAVSAAHSELGGLAIDVELPVTSPPPE